ncbi:MAG: ATP-binding cassette domain-containing protein [Rhodobacteraceae bacterium]|nr:ATP-binding cassette domain-containing protein [Paracoccaceae bacterium]
MELKRPRGAVTLEKLSFSYANAARPTIDGIELSLPASGVHALIGRNGSGKSTVLKLLQGLYPPSAGRVLLDGADIKQFTRSELAAGSVMSPRNACCSPVRFAKTSVTVIRRLRTKTLSMPPRPPVCTPLLSIWPMVMRQISARPDTVYPRVNVSVSPSPGRWLVALPLLLLDEPSSNLDREAEIELGNSVAAIGGSQTVLIVTHSPVLLSLCHRIFALDRGRVILSGPAIEILPRILNRDRPSQSPITTGKGLAEGPGAPPSVPASLVRETGAP